MRAFTEKQQANLLAPFPTPSPELWAPGADEAVPESQMASFAHDFSRVPVRAEALPALQAKLVVGASGDSYEQEADRVADQVMSSTEAAGPCACGGDCPKCSAGAPPRLQTLRPGSDAASESEAPPLVRQVLGSAGHPIDSATRAAMESGFGYDFSRVRLHTDERAARSARAINALAYTAGNHIAFATDQYQPQSSAGLRLFAHELTHVVQQADGAGLRVQRQPAFPKKGIQITGPGARELVQILTDCSGTQLSVDKDDKLQDSGKKSGSKNTSAAARQQIQSLIKNPNGLIIDTNTDVPGALVGSYRQATPGFHNVNIEHIKALQGASGAGAGVEACSAVLHEISEAANARTLDVQGKTPKTDIFKPSHEYGIDIENKIRADFKLPARDKAGSMFAQLYFVDNSFFISLFSNVFGTGAELRTQLAVIKTPIIVVNGKRQAQGNEILASHVEKGTVAMGTTTEAAEALKKFFPSLHAKFTTP